MAVADFTAPRRDSHGSCHGLRVGNFRGRRTARVMWLVLESKGASMCLVDPGFDTDLLVTADLASLYKVWLGRLSFDEALREDLVHLDGPSALVRAFPRWFKWSPFADAVRAAARLAARAGVPEQSTRA